MCSCPDVFIKQGIPGHRAAARPESYAPLFTSDRMRSVSGCDCIGPLQIERQLRLAHLAIQRGPVESSQLYGRYPCPVREHRFTVSDEGSNSWFVSPADAGRV